MNPRLLALLGQTATLATVAQWWSRGAGIPPGEVPAVAGQTQSLAQRIDACLDARYEPARQPTAALVAELGKADCDAARLEGLLRAGRAAYPKPPERGRVLGPLSLDCEHLDHSTAWLLYVPRDTTRTRRGRSWSWAMVAARRGT